MSMEKMTPERLKMLEKSLADTLAQMQPEDITGKGVRHNLVDWDEVLDAFTEREWFTVKQVQAFVEENYKKPECYYSEVLRVLRQVHKAKTYHVTKKRVPAGELKGVYYKLEEL